MDYIDFVKDTVLLSEKAKEYFAEEQTQQRHRKTYFQKMWNGELNEKNTS